jgi:hypothetical protein
MEEPWLLFSFVSPFPHRRKDLYKALKTGYRTVAARFPPRSQPRQTFELQLMNFFVVCDEANDLMFRIHESTDGTLTREDRDGVFAVYSFAFVLVTQTSPSH